MSVKENQMSEEQCPPAGAFAEKITSENTIVTTLPKAHEDASVAPKNAQGTLTRGGVISLGHSTPGATPTT